MGVIGMATHKLEVDGIYRLAVGLSESGGGGAWDHCFVVCIIALMMKLFAIIQLVY